jgi:hypothetical protein
MTPVIISAGVSGWRISQQRWMRRLR